MQLFCSPLTDAANPNKPASITFVSIWVIRIALLVTILNKVCEMNKKIDLNSKNYHEFGGK